MSYKIYKEFPILYGTEKNGKVKMWKTSVYFEENGDKAMSIIEFGQIDGKKQIANREYIEGKNIGKKNQTTPLQQCLNETQKKWTDKKEKDSYREANDNKDSKQENYDNKDSKEERCEKYFPMLAHTYDPDTNKNKKNNIVFPCYVQPKLDGLRCIMYKDVSGKVRCQSRTGTYFDTMEHITSELKNLFYNPLILDGELYTDNIPFEELSGLIKKKKISDSDRERLKNVKYHVYDIVDSSKTYEQRHKDITRLIVNNYEYVVSVPTYISNKDNFKNFFGEFIETGYEGIMLRNINGMYRCNYRSHDLQKYKEFMESEYEIIGFKEGDGRDKGTVIWVCKSENKEFSVRPKGTMESRRELFINAKKYIGKKLTVIYQELSELGVPRFPVGKAIRDGY
jgi:ATP-dependent DNA ligase